MLTKTKPLSATDITNLPDDTAIELIRAGNNHAWEIIMRRYNQRLYRAAHSILIDNDAAEDAVQQAYICAYYKLANYTHQGSLGAWLTRITINEALMIKRKPDNRISDICIDNSNLTETHTNPAADFANKELATLIETSVKKLPDNFRCVFVLRAIQQLSTKETAQSLSLNEATVKTRYHRARNLMQTELNQHIEQAGLQVFEFAGKRCDQMVYAVLNQLEKLNNTQD